MCTIAMPHAATYEMNPSHSRTQVTGTNIKGYPVGTLLCWRNRNVTGLEADR